MAQRLIWQRLIAAYLFEQASPTYHGKIIGQAQCTTINRTENENET